MTLETSPSDFATISPSPATPSSKATKTLLGAGFALTVGLFVWICMGIASSAWLAWQVPLLESDLAHASWLSSPTVALHFSEEPMAYALATGLMLIGVAVGIAKNSLTPALVAGFLFTSVHLGAGKETVVRMGVLDDVIKVGCYVQELKECHKMLGAPSDGLNSRYGLNSQHSAWYASEREKAVTSKQESMASLYSLPGMALIRAPLHFGHAQRLKEKLALQRKAVLALQRAGLPSSTLPAR